ncbi:lysophospholipid acyltransferase family protein [Parapedobacter koreensis]|uniref:KDO2-lipid IV(A) lauroyltransferase n=1 Tax=Parapedobacter koreensis TaxID=332977 RepID=A0A1H7QAE2_9SPHI|nr:lysophospholipid acyltransferase family protein [Parapedobacter koreensis]SEL44455.1 KDO2-lipid IV(A) lauroyltransferase [Parapedobacter koreensis]
MLGYFLGKVIRYRLNVCIQNLSRAFPSFSYKEISECTAEFYQNLAKIGWEVLFPSVTKLEVSLATIAEIWKSNKRLRPTILLMGHYGNWEVLNKLPRHIDVRVNAIYKPIKNNFVDYFVRSRRTKHGLRLIKSGHALRVLLKEKDNNSIILFIADQFPGNGKGIAVDFLNQQTRMFSGAEQLARRLGAFVGYVELTSKPNHIWKMEIQTICENASETADGCITTMYAKMLEQSICKDPAWWLWSHRRWK